MNRAPRRAAVAPALAGLAWLPWLSWLSLLLALACGPPSSGKSAETLYSENCVRCHQSDGRGDERARDLAPNVDLTRSAMVRRGARGLIFQRITRGYGSMPGFGYRLEKGDVDVLVEYVLRFQEK